MDKRVDAIHFSLEHDDGTKPAEYDEAEIILIGVSRSGKTPVSIYLATHMELKAANFPLTSDHLDKHELPKEIVRNRKRAVGLTCSPNYLHNIREKRYAGSTYASWPTAPVSCNRPNSYTCGTISRFSTLRAAPLKNLPSRLSRPSA